MKGKRLENENSKESILYIVATPVGNLEDMTFRAVRILRTVDVIAAEDTRRTKGLLSHFSIPVKRLISCRAYNESQSAKGIVKLLGQGLSVAYVSDAGTPTISDPGQILVYTVREAGFDIVPIPGPSALTALLCVSGLKSRNFIFDGFLSPKKGRRQCRIKELFRIKMPFVIYESSRRLVPLLEDIENENPESHIFIGREITKKFEEFLSGRPREVLTKLEIGGRLSGEFAIIAGIG